jgi:phage-related protein
MSNDAFPLPDRIAWDSGVRIEHQVDVLVNGGGHEQRVARWATPLRAYPLRLAEMSDAEWQTLEAFIEARGGPLDNFLLTEPITGTVRRCRFAENVVGLAWRFYNGTYADEIMVQEVRDSGP